MIPTPPASSSIAPRFIATHNVEPKAPRQKRLPKDITKRLQDFFDHTSEYPTPAQYNALLEEIRKSPGMEKYTTEKIKDWFKRRRGRSSKRQASGSAKPKVSSPPQHNPRYPTLTPDVLQKLDNVWTSVPPDKRHQLYDHWMHVAYADAGASPEDVGRWLQDRERADAAALCVDTNTNAAHAYSTPAPTTTSESPVPRWRDSPCSARAVSTYLPPTPTSSRAPSLVLKSEPTASPVTPFSSLPPLPSSIASRRIPVSQKPSIPPPMGLRILEAVKREMDEDKLFAGPEFHLPHNYAEFEAMFQPWEDKMHLVLNNLQDIHWHPLGS